MSPSVLLATLLLLSVAPAAAAPERRPVPVHEREAPIGLKPCKRPPEARCGSIKVPLDRQDPELGKIKIGFELHKRTEQSLPSLGTIVAVEGGPGFSTTGSRSYYLDLFEPLLDRRDLLLVDNRGTGRSEPILCQPLQSYEGDYVDAVGKCGRQLGDAADLYGTGNAADDMAAVLDALGIDRVDLYGDSYGTFFGQTFAVRHPDRLRSLVLDSAYFVGGTDPFYVDTNRALRDAFNSVCERRPSCARRPGSPMKRIARLAEMLRDEPIRGRAPGADGRIRRVEVDVGGLIYLVTSAASSPTLYRELDAAGRASLRERAFHRPLLRLARETFYVGGAGSVRWYSEGLYVAVSCNDYPQAYDMTAPISVRKDQYRAAIDELRRTRPRVFRPFTIREWVTSPVEYFDSCIKWPRPSRVDPPVPPGATFPDVPTLVLAGDLDSLTSPEGARLTAEAFLNSTYVEVANMTHVTALADFRRCASDIVLRFVRNLSAGNTSCAARYNEIRAVDRYARTAAATRYARPRRRTARIATETVADVIARWFGMQGTRGIGLHGGRFSTQGLRHVRWDLHQVRLVRDVAVSGNVSWHRWTGRIEANVRVTGKGARPARLAASWNDREPLGEAVVKATFPADRVRFEFPAP